MKTLYLVRHAKSSWDYPALDDLDRPLNARGEKDAPEMGRRLKAQGVMPDLVVTSPAKRALATCHIITAALDYPADRIRITENLYHAGEKELLGIIRKTDPQVRSLMIFGHNPGLTYFADKLTDLALDNIPTCGVFSCTFTVDQWRDIGFGTGTLLFYDYPKKARI